jgi:WD40 repeat protein
LAASSKAGLLGIIDSKCLGEILDTGTLEPAYNLPAGMYAKAISLDGTRGVLDLIGPECQAEYTQPIVVEFPSGRLLARLPEGSVEDAYLSPDGQLAVATLYDTGKTYLYDIEAGQVLLTFDSEYFVFAFSPDGQQLAATATDGALTVFDVATLRAGGSEGQGLIWSIAAHVVIIPFVQYTPDGSAIVTAGRNDSLVRVWDPATGERIAEFFTDRDAERLPFFDISSDGRHMIALGGDDTLRVYTLDTDELIQIAKDRVTRSFTEDECRAHLHLESCPESSPG